LKARNVSNWLLHQVSAFRFCTASGKAIHAFTGGKVRDILAWDA
jgi:hypothetical protein